MHVRFAVPNDLETCLHLDDSFDTRRVWQLDLRESRDHVSAQLRSAALPRELRLDYPSPDDACLLYTSRCV